ncbi:hypothetical protein [Alienimonas chondri]|uniref:Uncharacterized protein n=1 Tax=Alienimonas chondri TaxID=2681879 RepID=A0ABX1VN75_9PLAN|nr:hypothetical protein [Alienimonas chondri]NNJ27871.1 hypothetical protein [Alienimonas chondri]
MMDAAATPTTWLMLLVALAAVLLIVVPLVTAIVLAVRGRRGWAVAAGTVAMTVFLLGGTLISVRTADHGQREYQIAVAEQRQRHVESMTQYQAEVDHMRLTTRFANDDRVQVRDDGVFVTQEGPDGQEEEVRVGPPAPWRDAARQHDERLRQRDQERRRNERRPQQVHAPVPADLVSEDDLPEWIANPGTHRIVVVGPLTTDEDGGPTAARAAAERTAAAQLAEAAGLPPDAHVNPDDVTRSVRRAAVVPFTRTTGENAFTVYQGHLLVDASPQSLDHLHRGYRSRIGNERAVWAVGGAGALVVLFSGLWGLGRRKLRRA